MIPLNAEPTVRRGDDGTDRDVVGSDRDKDGSDRDEVSSERDEDGSDRDEDGSDRDRDLEARLNDLERDQRRLETTVRGVAREMGFSTGCLCSQCEASYTIQQSDSMYCPSCRNRTCL
ncbi:hypothetical protein [Natrarchaeobius chitinivorans]|uniref:hypothetical protein n=1 Tax=Natrarchaeobius chitinivorans TaxID=1679083 RepID=UPI001FB20B62|nr:hypothetical protein [Natrarchaeobius chitinivorans]